MNKKDVLFYTFLAIFVVTAAITVLGILDVVAIREGYLNTLVGVFVVELAGAVIAMFRKVDFFSDAESSPKKPPSPASPPSAKSPDANGTSSEPPTAKKSSLCADEYFAKLATLEGRFAEQEEFAAEMNGATVEWKGEVQSVHSHNAGPGRAILVLVWRNIDPLKDGMALWLPDECRTRAFALRRGDIISFTGVLDTVTSGVGNPNIKALTFRVEEN